MKHPVFNGQPILKLEQNRMEDIKSYLGFGFYVLSPTPRKKEREKETRPHREIPDSRSGAGNTVSLQHPPVSHPQM